MSEYHPNLVEGWQHERIAELEAENRKLREAIDVLDKLLRAELDRERDK